MKITPEDLIRLKIVDRIVPEPAGGAHSAPAAAIRTVGDAVEEELKALSELSADELRRQCDNFIELDELREVIGRPPRGEQAQTVVTADEDE